MCKNESRQRIVLNDQVNVLVYNDLVENPDVRDAMNVKDESIADSLFDGCDVLSNLLSVDFLFSLENQGWLDKDRKERVVNKLLRKLEDGHIDCVVCFFGTISKEEAPNLKQKFPSLGFYICVNEGLMVISKMPYR